MYSQGTSFALIMVEQGGRLVVPFPVSYFLLIKKRAHNLGLPRKLVPLEWVGVGCTFRTMQMPSRSVGLKFWEEICCRVLCRE